MEVATVLARLMPNPNGGPEEHRFKPGDDPKRNGGGRTPTKWLREFLDAAHDKADGSGSRREAIAHHLVEVATSWKVVVRGRGENAIDVASAADSVKAAELLYAYDMGKPVDSLEVSNPDGSLTPAGIAMCLNSEQRATAIAALDARLAALRAAGKPDGTNGT